MITFQGRIEAEDKEYSNVAARGKEIIDLFEKTFRGVKCPQHAFHHVKVLLSFSKDAGMGIEITNSCCKKFTDLFDQKIKELMV